MTTYHFRTRAAMIEALLAHISHRLVEWTADGYRRVLASDPATFDREAFSRERMTEATTTFRTLMLAKFELYLDAARHPERQRALRALRADHIEQQAAVFRVLGARDPKLAANRLLSALEGAMIYQLSAPEDGYERWVGSYIAVVMDALVDFIAPPASPERPTP